MLLKIAGTVVAAGFVAAAVALLLVLDDDGDPAPASQASDDASDGDSEPAEGDPPDPDDGDDEGDGASTPPQDEPTTEAEDPTTYRFVPGSLLLVSVSAEVRGLTGFGEFDSSVDPEVWGPWLAAEREGPTPAPPPTMPDATCTMLGDVVLEVTGDSAVVSFDARAFDAGIRRDQNNHLSIGATTDEAGHYVTIGGYSEGSGGRNDSRQWALQDGSLRLEWTSSDSGEWWGRWLYVNATWTGPAIENFSGEQANATVDFECAFLPISP